MQRHAPTLAACGVSVQPEGPCAPASAHHHSYHQQVPCSTPHPHSFSLSVEPELCGVRNLISADIYISHT